MVCFGPVVCGSNSATSVHVAPPASAPAPQVPPVTVKSAVVPETVRPPDGMSPALVTVNVWLGGVPPTVTPPKAKVVGLIERLACARPVPETGAVTVPPGAPVSETLPAAAPRAVGAKTIANVQLAPAASEVPVHPSAAGTLWNGPESSTLVSAPVAVPPVFVAVNVAGAETWPTTSGANVRVAGVSVNVAGVAGVAGLAGEAGGATGVTGATGATGATTVSLRAAALQWLRRAVQAIRK